MSYWVMLKSVGEWSSAYSFINLNCGFLKGAEFSIVFKSARLGWIEFTNLAVSPKLFSVGLIWPETKKSS